MNFLLIILMLCKLPAQIWSSPEYRWVIPILDSEACSENQTCPTPDGGNETHTYCFSKDDFFKIQKKSDFSDIPMDDTQRLTYLLGINGIRNKIAMDWRLSNMNRLHWSKMLHELSMRFLWECRFTTDNCNYIGNPRVTISQNMVFVKRSEVEDDNPYGYALRKWYSEFVKKESSFEEYESRFKNQRIEGIGNFTNMIWPTTEMLGCAAAK